MVRMLDLIVIFLLVAVFVALTLYKVIVSFRYRNDPAKWEALISTGQVYPKRLMRFIFDENPDSEKEPSPPNSVNK
jgi:nitrate reductase gamma subunit